VKYVSHIYSGVVCGSIAVSIPCPRGIGCWAIYKKVVDQTDDVSDVDDAVMICVAAYVTATNTQCAHVNSAVRIAQRVTSSTFTTGTVIQIMITSIRITKEGVAGNVAVNAELTLDTPRPVPIGIAVNVTAGEDGIGGSVLTIDSAPKSAEGDDGVPQYGRGFVTAVNSASILGMVSAYSIVEHGRRRKVRAADAAAVVGRAVGYGVVADKGD
jgi:hypothetical protein